MRVIKHLRSPSLRARQTASAAIQKYSLFWIATSAYGLLAMTVKRWAFPLAIVLAALTLTARPASALESVLKARLGTHPDKTRLVLETTKPTPFKVFTLSNPNRVVVDFENLVWAASENPQGDEIVRNYRHGHPNPDTLRIVLETSNPVKANGFFIPPVENYPPRFILDMRPIKPALTPAAASPLLLSKANAAQLPSKSIQQVSFVKGVPIPPRPPVLRSQEKPVIMIDPGHGGIDPGAMSILGVDEKNITLSTAYALKNELEKTNHYKVLLTRDNDTFIPLRDRAAKARELGANLFISLHADSIEQKAVRGLSVYTLSDLASDREAAMLADKENRVDSIAGVKVESQDDDVVNILIDLAQRNTMNQSRRFAHLLVRQLNGNIQLLHSPVRSAGFAVLTAPDVPSVLIEMGYLSSPADSSLLTSSAHHRLLAKKITTAVDKFFGLTAGKQSKV